MRKESFLSAQSEIQDYLYSDNLKAYTTFDITKIFEKMRNEWSIANYRNQYHFMKFLEDVNILKNIKLKHQDTGSIKQVFIEPNVSKFYMAQTIKKEGYLSNYSAMQIHQLTLQIPKSIYLSYSHSKSNKENRGERKELLQQSIDNAFSRPQRATSDVYRSEIDNSKIFLIQKEYNPKKIGIIEKDGLFYTDLERTLIDIAIRPAYSGGIFEVLDAFKNSKEKVDVDKLESYLEELDYIYPYHQLIGYYMDKAGYEPKKLEKFVAKISNLNFYLTYNISNKLLDNDWRVYYPTGF
ncbi:type IV toxin-antitoxin system AbiEi family antitoxin domain-containing protein [Flavobacterium yafengii]|uniref:type IV toxin-antitoxin system AbiEi family antitoxin domain-containing protein n=1 Tax=Flavobacterium yafengii TaxID=3041253 RepID=UPI0024A8C9F1|nr:hypothetical protein [Flavobacterium yafengii]MDI5898307.1 hypothetical protein [Flavobacterium yafengii]